MKKVIIGYNQEGKTQHDKDSWEKLRILDFAVQEYKQHFTNEIDMFLFEQNPYSYAVSQVRLLNPAAEVLQLSAEAICGLYHFKLDVLKSLSETYLKMDIKLSFSKGMFDISNAVDFNIYCATEEQITRYNDALELVKVITEMRNKYNEHGTHINAESIYKYISTDGVVMQPSLYFIQS